MSELINMINLLDLSQILKIASVFTITYYLIQCFFGYKLLKISCAVFGFLAGFVVGFAATLYFTKETGYWPAIIGMAAGILLALLAFKLYLVGVFIYCGLLAAQASLLIPIPDEEPWNTVRIVVYFAAFVIVGIIAVKFSRFCIIAVTAVGGAINAILKVQTIVPILQENLMFCYMVIIACAALGFLVQYMTNRK